MANSIAIRITDKILTAFNKMNVGVSYSDVTDTSFTAEFDFGECAEAAWELLNHFGGRVGASWDGDYEIKVEVK